MGRLALPKCPERRTVTQSLPSASEIFAMRIGFLPTIRCYTKLKHESIVGAEASTPSVRSADTFLDQEGFLRPKRLTELPLPAVTAPHQMQPPIALQEAVNPVKLALPLNGATVAWIASLRS